MISQTYVSRREASAGFVRNRNIVRHTKRNLGSISQTIIVAMLTLVFGLIYVAEGTKATSLDYQISEMTARRDDLAVEKARLTSVVAAKNSTVAAAMEDAVVTGYVAD